MESTQGHLSGNLSDVGGGFVQQAKQQVSTGMVKTFLTMRINQLVKDNWRRFEAEWIYSWHTYLRKRGVPRWYINTNSIPEAAFQGVMAEFLRTLVVEIRMGERIRISGAFVLNSQAVLTWHNQHRSAWSSKDSADVAYGVNPKSLGLKGSFRAQKHTFLEEFLLAGPNKTAGRLPSPSGLRGKGNATYDNVFSALGNKWHGTTISTTRAGAATGDFIMSTFAKRLGFTAEAHRITGPLWTVYSSLSKMSQGVMFDVLQKAMEDTRKQFPGMQFTAV